MLTEEEIAALHSIQSPEAVLGDIAPALRAMSRYILAAARPPECDGDHEHMDCIEDDGFVTCYFSGPIKPI